MGVELLRQKKRASAVDSKQVLLRRFAYFSAIEDNARSLIKS
ncbi:MAG: hypothetical protein ACI9BW_004388 [Gammaproteobacteria bacterium]